MSAIYLNAADYSVGDPVVIAGWQAWAGTDRLRISTAGTSPTQNCFYQSGLDSNPNACVYLITPVESPVIRTGFVIPNGYAAIGNVKGSGVINSSGNGYGIIHSGGGASGSFGIRLIVNGLISASNIGTYSSGLVLNDRIYMDRNHATGEMQCYRSAGGTGDAELFLTITDTTYDDCFHPCIISQGSASFVVSALYESVGGTITYLTDPVTMGQGFTAESAGFTTVTSVSAIGLSATDVAFDDGEVTGNWPTLADGQVITVALPATGVEFTFSDGTDSATYVSDADLPDGFAAVEFGTQIDEPDYLLEGIPIEVGFRGYYETNQPTVGDVVIYPDGSVYTDAGGNVTLFLHKLGDDDSIAEYVVTAPAEGGGGGGGRSLSVRGLSVRGLSVSGLSVRGLGGAAAMAGGFPYILPFVLS